MNDYIKLADLFEKLAEQETGYKAQAFHNSSTIVLNAQTTDPDILSTYRGFGSSSINITNEFNSTGTSSRLNLKPITDIKNESIESEEKEGLIKEITQRHSKRFTRNQADAVINKFKQRAIDKVGTLPLFKIAGSYRRNSPTIGDLDFIAINFPENLKSKLTEVFDKISMSGSKKISGDIDGIQIDVQFLDLNPGEDDGAHMLHSTGPASLNIYMRKCALRRGWSLSQYGLKDSQGNLIAQKEKDIFEKLKLPYLTPEQRNNWQDFYE
jgi:DNA polymerase/3'-5' exonuclease PolX